MAEVNEEPGFTQFEKVNILDTLLIKGELVEPFEIPSVVVRVAELSDLPTPIANVIQLASNTLYLFIANVDVEDNQLVAGANTYLEGIRDTLTQLSGTTTGPLLSTNGTRAINISNLSLLQNGSGTLASFNTTTLTETISFTNCLLTGGDVRLIQGGTVEFNRVFLGVGARIVQDGGGGFTNIRFEGCTFGSAGVTDGIVNFETGSSTMAVLINNCDMTLSVASTVFTVERDATIENFLFMFGNMKLNIAGATIMKMENPNDITFGFYHDSVVEVSAAQTVFLRCQPDSSSTLTATGASSPTGICQDGDDTHNNGNIIVSDPATNTVYRYEGLSNTAKDSIAITSPQQLAWHRGDLYILSGTTITQYDQFSTTVLDSITTPQSNPSGIVFVGNDLVSCDSMTNEIFIHDGFTTTTTSFDSPAQATLGVAFDGINLLIGDESTNTVFVMIGISPLTQYVFSTLSDNTLDLSMTLNRLGIAQGFALTDLDHGEFRLYDHPVTFDHSSPSWDIQNVTSSSKTLDSSADRGGVLFFTPPDEGVDITGLLEDIWVDLADGGVDIFYGFFSENEKMLLNNEENGEIIWTATREKARVITGQVTYGKTGAGDDIYQIALVINGVVQKDSITAGVLIGNNSVTTINTLPISREIVRSDVIKLQMRRTAGNDDPTLFFSKLSIN